MRISLPSLFALALAAAPAYADYGATVCAATTNNISYPTVYGAAWPPGQGYQRSDGTYYTTTATAVRNSADTGGTHVEHAFQDYSDIDNEGVAPQTRAERAVRRFCDTIVAAHGAECTSYLPCTTE